MKNKNKNQLNELHKGNIPRDSHPGHVTEYNQSPEASSFCHPITIPSFPPKVTAILSNFWTYQPFDFSHSVCMVVLVCSYTMFFLDDHLVDHISHIYLNTQIPILRGGTCSSILLNFIGLSFFFSLLICRSFSLYERRAFVAYICVKCLFSLHNLHIHFYSYHKSNFNY